MKKALSFLIIVFLFANCTVPYDGETRYIFETIVVDSNNNPIANLKCNAVFYNLYSNENRGIINPIEGADLIVSSVSDANGKVRLIFPFSESKERLKIEIGNDDNSFPQNLFEFINMRESDFNDFKRTEPTVMLFKENELVGLQILVSNSNSNNYISKMEFTGKKRETVKNFQPTPNEFDPLPITNSFYDVVKDQVATLKYEVTTLSTSGQATFAIIEVPITVLSENIIYEISL